MHIDSLVFDFTFMEKGKLSELFDSNDMVGKERSHSLWLNKKWKSMKTNSESPTRSSRPSLNLKNLTFSYLVNAWKILMESEWSPTNKSKAMENQSSNSIDEATSSTAKRPRSGDSFQIIPSKWPQSWLMELSEDSDFNSTKHVIKSKKFGDRPDVIYKTILRSFKKFYLAEFNESTGFKRKKRRISHQSVLIELANEYVNERIPENPYEDLGLFITALVQSKQETLFSVDPKLAQLSMTVKEVLYRFNKSKMNDLLAYPQFSFILKRFLSIPNLLEFIGEKSSSPQSTQNLTAQINFLAEKWDEVLTTPARFGEFAQNSENPEPSPNREILLTFD